MIKGVPLYHNRMLAYFSYDHLPEHLQEVSKPFHALATKIVRQVAAGKLDRDESLASLRKLLEAKDAAVRAALPPVVDAS